MYKKFFGLEYYLFPFQFLPPYGRSSNPRQRQGTFLSPFRASSVLIAFFDEVLLPLLLPPPLVSLSFYHIISIVVALSLLSTNRHCTFDREHPSAVFYPPPNNQLAPFLFPRVISPAISPGCLDSRLIGAPSPVTRLLSSLPFAGNSYRGGTFRAHSPILVYCFHLRRQNSHPFAINGHAALFTLRLRNTSELAADTIGARKEKGRLMSCPNSTVTHSFPSLAIRFPRYLHR